MSGHYYYESNKNSVGFHRNNNEIRYSENNPYRNNYNSYSQNNQGTARRNNNEIRYSENNPYRNNYNSHSQNNQGIARRNNNGLPPRFSYNERNRGYSNEQSSSYHNYSGRFNNDQSLSRRSNNFTIYRRNEQDFSRGGRRPGPYDTISRSRQSSINYTTRNVRVRPSTDILAGLDESPSENCDWSIYWNHQQISSWNAAAQDPSLLKSNPPPKEKAYGVVESKEEKKISTTSSTSSEKKNIWVTQNEFTPLNSVAIRPHSPLPFELLDEDNNKMVARNNKGKSRASRDRYQEEDLKNANDDTNNYKGISFSPPFPIIPASSVTNEKPTILPDIDRIFEDDSRSAAQTFENLRKIAKTLWNDFTDVPLDLASEQDVNPEEYLKVNRKIKRKFRGF
ncbi:hypothetical protein C1645_804175 [Glomus cerebriforme]|uniref:Uncharacterized protein n=1 Tax=Glomus cerebriforme TaxID=658196 RepID=A0A397TA87_9GLOM|nr:hypothetical protein C1645_804175 [Glomus cerebriforme]